PCPKNGSRRPFPSPRGRQRKGRAGSGATLKWASDSDFCHSRRLKRKTRRAGSGSQSAHMKRELGRAGALRSPLLGEGELLDDLAHGVDAREALPGVLLEGAHDRGLEIGREVL